MQLNFNQLYTFYIVAQTGSLTLATKKLHVSVPAVSIQLKRLEESLGFALFIRENNSLKLTNAAKNMFPLVAEMFSSAVKVQHFLETMKNVVDEKIIIGVRIAVAQTLMPDFLKYIDKNSSLKAEMIIEYQDQFIEKLRSNTFDIAIITSKTSYNDIEFIEFFSNEIVYGVCKDNPFFHNKTEISLKDIKDIPSLLPTTNSGFGRHVVEFLSEKGISLNVHMSDLASPVAATIVPGTNYGAFLGRAYIEEEFVKGKIRLIKFKEKIPPATCYIAFLKNKKNSRAIKEFLDCVLPAKNVINYLHTKDEI